MWFIYSAHKTYKGLNLRQRYYLLYILVALLLSACNNIMIAIMELDELLIVIWVPRSEVIGVLSRIDGTVLSTADGAQTYDW